MGLAVAIGLGNVAIVVAGYCHGVGDSLADNYGIGADFKGFSQGIAAPNAPLGNYLAGQTCGNDFLKKRVVGQVELLCDMRRAR